MMHTVHAGVAAERRSVVTIELDVLFRREHARLVKALTVVGGDYDMAEEAVQEAFLRAFRHWERVSGYDDPAAWVRHVALNRLRSLQRSPWRRLRPLGGWSGGESAGRVGGALSAHGAAVDASAGATGALGNPTAREPGESTAAHLAEALRELPPRQREAAVLFYAVGFSVRETAGIMGVSEGAVKQHLSRAREHLRRIVEVES